MVWLSCESQWYSLLAEGRTVTIMVRARYPYNRPTIIQIRRIKIVLKIKKFLLINLSCHVEPIFVEDNKESCDDSGDHDEDLGDIQRPPPVEDVVQRDIRERWPGPL